MSIDLDVHGNTKPLEAAVQAAVNRIRRQPIKVSVDDKGATQPLGNMRRSADEFTKSMEAANARILAFGASMAIINGISNAFKAMVVNLVEVEKALADINVVMGLSTENLQAFSSGLFDAAKETGQAFKVASDAAVEYARQGLSVEETLKRTRDALILTRLTGMDSANAVKALTAAMNTYGSEIKDTTELVSKFAAVDVQFAVSAEDFADAIARTGQSAKSAGVDIDELVGIVTAAQQQTARGGKVIGNSLKTIFTRVGRTGTLDQLEELGIAVRDVEGNTINATRILTDLANTFDGLSESQKAQIAQTVGGVFQINILKAVLSDAAKQNGILARATEISSSATDEAIQKNDQLRDTISALATETGLALKEMSAAVGEVVLAPGMEKILNTFKSFAEGANDLIGDGESAGSKFANGFLAGIGNILSGPGLVVLTAVFFKLFGQAVKFTRESLGSLIGITSEAKKQQAIQSSLVNLFSQNAALNKEMLRTDISKVEKEKIILGLIKSQIAEAKVLNTIAQQASSTLYQQGFGANLTRRTKKGRSAEGFIPNFAKTSTKDKFEEEEAAKEAGYKPGQVRSMRVPGEGDILYNTAETIKYFPGIKQPAIMPPSQTKAGSNYKQAFEDIHGFNPYEASGVDSVDKSRNQKYTPNSYLKKVQRLRSQEDLDVSKDPETIIGSQNQRTPPKERRGSAEDSGSKNQTAPPQERQVQPDQQEGSKNQKTTPKEFTEPDEQKGSRNQIAPPQERQAQPDQQEGSKNQKATPKEFTEPGEQKGSKNQTAAPQERQLESDDQKGSKNQVAPPQERQQKQEQKGSKNQTSKIKITETEVSLASELSKSSNKENKDLFKKGFDKLHGKDSSESKTIFSDNKTRTKGIDPNKIIQGIDLNKGSKNQIAPPQERQLFPDDKEGSRNQTVRKTQTDQQEGSKNQKTTPKEFTEPDERKGSKNQTTAPEGRQLEPQEQKGSKNQTDREVQTDQQVGSKNQKSAPQERQVTEEQKIDSKNQKVETSERREDVDKLDLPDIKGGSKNQSSPPQERQIQPEDQKGSKNQITEPQERKFEVVERGSKNQKLKPYYQKDLKIYQTEKETPILSKIDQQNYRSGFEKINGSDAFNKRFEINRLKKDEEEVDDLKKKPKPYALGYVPNFANSSNQRLVPKDRQEPDLFDYIFAEGFVPSPEKIERKEAVKSGYAPGAIKSMDIPGEGPVVYNSAEHVKTFPGMSQPAIMPPAKSRAGQAYQKEFGKVHGFDPYNSDGYIPNFALPAGLSPVQKDAIIQVASSGLKWGDKKSKEILDAAWGKGNVPNQGKLFEDYADTIGAKNFQRLQEKQLDIEATDKAIENAKAAMLVPPEAGSGIASYGTGDIRLSWPVYALKAGSKTVGTNLTESIKDSSKNIGLSYANQIRALINEGPVEMGAFNHEFKQAKGAQGGINAAVGGIFETAVNTAVSHTPEPDKRSDIYGDFDVRGPGAVGQLRRIFTGLPKINLADYKNSLSTSNKHSFYKKLISEFGVRKTWEEDEVDEAGNPILGKDGKPRRVTRSGAIPYTTKKYKLSDDLKDISPAYKDLLDENESPIKKNGKIVRVSRKAARGYIPNFAANSWESEPRWKWSMNSDYTDFQKKKNLEELNKRINKFGGSNIQATGKYSGYLPVARITDRETGTYTDFTYGKGSGEATNSTSIIYSSRGKQDQKGGAFRNLGALGDFTKKQGGKDPSIYSDFDQINHAEGKSAWAALLRAFPQLKQRIKPGMATSGEMNIGYDVLRFNSLRSLKMQVSKWVNKNGVEAFLNFSKGNLGFNEKNAILGGTSSGDFFSIGGLKSTMLNRRNKNYLNDSKVGFSAEGHVPNFANPLSNAINREKAAGVPVNQIRVDAHSALVKKENPLGLGVTNTRDEPNGLRDVFGTDSYIPNYAMSDKIGPLTHESYKSAVSELEDSIKEVNAEIDKDLKERKSSREKRSKLHEERQKLLKKGNRRTSQEQNQLTASYKKTEKLKNQEDNIRKRIISSKEKIAQQEQQRTKLDSSLGGKIDKYSKGGVGKFSKGLGKMFSGNAGMMMMMGAPMAAGFLQQSGPGGGAGGAAYAAGGALTGASSGAMMASMIAPLAGPFAPLVTVLGAVTGGLFGLLGATEENAEAMRKSAVEFDKERIKKNIETGVSGFNAVKNDLFKLGKQNYKGDQLTYQTSSLQEFERYRVPGTSRNLGKTKYRGDMKFRGLKAQEELQGLLGNEELGTQAIMEELKLDIEKSGSGAHKKETVIELDNPLYDDAILGAGKRDVGILEFANRIKNLKDYDGSYQNFEKDENRDSELEKIINSIAAHSEKTNQNVFTRLVKLRDTLNSEMSSAATADMTKVEEFKIQKDAQLRSLGLDVKEDYSMNEIVAQFGRSNFFQGDSGKERLGIGKELYSQYLDQLPDSKEISYKRQDGSNMTRTASDLKEDLDELDISRNAKEIEAILKSAGIEVGNLLDNYKKHNNAVIIRLNLEQAMIRNADLMFDEQMRIKRAYGGITNSLSNYEKVMAGSMNQETKARLGAAKAQVKLSQKYEEQLKKNEQTGINELLKIAQGSNVLKSAIKINLAKNSGDTKTEKDITDIEVNDALNAEFEKGADEFLEFLRTLTKEGTNESKALNNYERSSDLRNKQLNEGNKLDQDRLRINSRINVKLGEIADDASATAIKFKTAMDNLQHAASIRDIQYQRDQDNFQRPVFEGKTRGLYRTKQEELDVYEKFTLPKQQDDRITSFNQSTSTTAQQALDGMGLAGYYDAKDLQSLQTKDANSLSELGEKGTSSSFEEIVKTASEERNQKRLNELNTGLSVEGYTLESGGEDSAISRLKAIESDNASKFASPGEDGELSEDDKKKNANLESANILLAEQIKQLQQIKELKSEESNLSTKEKQNLEQAKDSLDNISEETKETLELDKQRLATLRQIDAFQRGSGAGYMVNGFRDAAKELRDQADYMDFKLGGDVARNFASGMADAMQVAINGAEDLDDQLRQIGLNFLMAIQRAMLQSFANRIVGAMGFNSGGRVKERHNGGIIRTYTRGGKAFQTDQAVARYNDGGRVRKYSSGGMVPAMISDGEYVMNRGAVSKYGTAFMHNLNSGIGIQQFAEGGDVASSEKKYRRTNVSGFFYSGSGNLGLNEDSEAARAADEEAIRKMEEAKQEAYEKKAKKRALISSLVTTVVMAGLNNAFDSFSDTGTGKLTGAAKEAGLTNKSLGGLGKNAVVGKNIDGSYKVFKNGLPSNAVSRGFLQSSPISNNKSPLQQINPFKGLFGGNKTQWTNTGSAADYIQGQMPDPWTFSSGGTVHNHNKGGHVSGKKGIDQIPAMLSDGEYVIKASSARKIGKANLDMVNAGKYNQGGLVGDSSGSSEFGDSSGGSSTNNINITVNVEKSGNSSSSKEQGNNQDMSADDKEKYKQMSEKIKEQVVAVIIEEKRPGGVLSESQ